MPARGRRRDRKLHKWYLGLGVIDASQHSHWRALLFAAPEGSEFPIDCRHTIGLHRSVAYGLRRYRLSYRVSRVAQAETTFAGEDWGDFVFFRFRATRYPELVAYTANNPAVV